MLSLAGYCPLLGADHTATGFLLHAAAHEHAHMIVNLDLFHSLHESTNLFSTRRASDGIAGVLGASIAGLLTARVLCGRFAEVVLLERDELAERPAPRKGTPHAVHPHELPGLHRVSDRVSRAACVR
jgi:hypothetical protein